MGQKFISSMKSLSESKRGLIVHLAIKGWARISARFLENQSSRKQMDDLGVHTQMNPKEKQNVM